METWDSGPFDNDTAAWCDDLGSDFVCEAIAAAAILAAQLPGGQPITPA